MFYDSFIFHFKLPFLDGNSTLRTASSRTSMLPKFHQIPAYVALFREKSLNRYLKLLFFDGNSTLRTASSRTCDLPKFHQIPAYVALFR